MRRYNFVIIGAGTAGSTAAKTAAESGWDVCLIDRKPKEKIGDKVCGEAVGKHHFDNLKISPSKGDEFAGKVIGIDVYSPDRETIFRIMGEGLHGFMINRHEFGQRILHEAIDKGAKFKDNTTVLKPIIKNEYVRGVKAKNTETDHMFEIYGDVTIDASGFTTTLRKQVPTSLEIETNIRNEDVAVCYREVREVITEFETPEYLQIYLSQEIAPGGYYWIFPKGKKRANVGIGVQMVKNFPNPKFRLYKYVLDQQMFKGSKILKAGGGLIPTRRPINCLVANGILFAGDAACQPNPIHGGGIGPSMIGGKLAAETAFSAIENGDVSKESLWQYNVQFMKGYGAKAASLDVFRIFLQKTIDEELNYGMKHRLIKEEDVLRTSLGDELNLNITEKARRAFRGIKRLTFLRQLDYTSKKMREIKALYRSYPPPNKFLDWKQKVDTIIKEISGAVS